MLIKSMEWQKYDTIKSAKMSRITRPSPWNIRCGCHGKASALSSQTMANGAINITIPKQLPSLPQTYPSQSLEYEFS